MVGITSYGPTLTVAPIVFSVVFKAGGLVKGKKSCLSLFLMQGFAGVRNKCVAILKKAFSRQVYDLGRERRNCGKN